MGLSALSPWILCGGNNLSIPEAVFYKSYVHALLKTEIEKKDEREEYGVYFPYAKSFGEKAALTSIAGNILSRLGQ